MLDIPGQIRVVIKLVVCEAVAHESESVLAPVADLKVFGPGGLYHLLEKQRTASESCSDSAVDSVVLVP